MTGRLDEGEECDKGPENSNAPDASCTLNCKAGECVPEKDPKKRCPKNEGDYNCPLEEPKYTSRGLGSKFCKHLDDGGAYDHKGTCYREMVTGGGGQQCCYSDGTDNCTGTYDKVSPMRRFTPGASFGNENRVCDVTRNVDFEAACTHCNEDVRPFCEKECKKGQCFVASGGYAYWGVTGNWPPSSLDAKCARQTSRFTCGFPCDWQFFDCGGTVPSPQGNAGNPGGDSCEATVVDDPNWGTKAGGDPQDRCSCGIGGEKCSHARPKL